MFAHISPPRDEKSVNLAVKMVEKGEKITKRTPHAWLERDRKRFQFLFYNFEH